MADNAGFRDTITEAIKYWEPRRLIYNGVLAAVVMAHFFSNLPQSRHSISIDLALLVFVLAVLANVAYCAAYLADIFAQASGLRELWFQFRWIVLALGIGFAAVITHFFASGMFLGRNG